MKPITLERIILHKLKIINNSIDLDTIITYYTTKTGVSIQESTNYINDLCSYYKILIASIPTLQDTPEIYAKKQENWIKQNNIKVGDTLTIVMGKNIGKGWHGGWTSFMSKVGESGIVRNILNLSIVIEFDRSNNLYCPYFIFDPINKS